MDAQLIVVIAGIIFVAVIIASLFFMRGYSGPYSVSVKSAAPRASEGEGNTPQVAFKHRFMGLSAAVGVVFSALIAKLWSMQMVSSDHYDEMAQINRTRTVTTPASRGRILDRNGVELVRNRPSLAVCAYSDVADNELEVRHLANVLGMPYVAVRRKIQDNTEGAQSPHTIVTDASRVAVSYIKEHSAQFEGVVIAERSMREYPFGSTAAHVLGYTGNITREQQEEFDAAVKEDKSAIEYQPGDVVGQAGVEARYEHALQGIRGSQTVMVDARGNVTDVSGSTPPQPGSDIKLTIDINIQKACERGIEKGVKIAKQMNSLEAGCGSCICLDCKNGEILGMANAPSYDPTVFTGGITADVWEFMQNEKNGLPLYNRSIAGQYVAASTIKPLSAIAGLEYGIVSPSDTVTCTGFWTGLGEANGKYCWDHDGHGTLTLQQGIAVSCDPVFYEIGKSFYYCDTPDGLQDTYRTWGLGSITGIDLNGELEGRVPDAEWKNEWFKDYDEEDRTWVPGDMCNLVIGQGDILVTPIQMAMVYAGIANNGVEMTPHVLKSIIARDGSGDAVSYEPKVRLEAKVNNESNLKLVQNGLHDVIYNASESVKSHFTSLPVTVCGKTGTGEKAGGDAYAWFAAYCPAEDPQYVCVAMLERAGGGSATALHVVREVFGEIYDVPDNAGVSATVGD